MSSLILFQRLSSMFSVISFASTVSSCHSLSMRLRRNRSSKLQNRFQVRFHYFPFFPLSLFVMRFACVCVCVCVCAHVRLIDRKINITRIKTMHPLALYSRSNRFAKCRLVLRFVHPPRCSVDVARERAAVSRNAMRVL